MQFVYRFTFSLLITFISFSLIAQYKVEPVVQFGHPGHTITGIHLSPDGETMATTDGEFIKLWDLSSGLEFRAFKGDNSGIYFNDFSPDGNQILYVSGSYLYTSSVLTGKVESKIPLKQYYESIGKPNFDDLTDDEIQKLLFTSYSEDHSLKSIINDKNIIISKTSTNELVQSIPIEQKVAAPREGGFSNFNFQLPQMKFSPDNKLFLLDSTLYDIKSGDIKYQFFPSKHNMKLIASLFNPNSQQLIFCGHILPSPEAKEKLEAEQEEKEFSLKYLQELMLGFQSIGTDPGESVIFANIETGAIVADNSITSVTTQQLSKDKKYLFTGHIDKSINVWDINSGAKKITIRLRPKEDLQSFDDFDAYGISTIIQTEDTKHLIVGGSGTVIEDQLSMWDFETGERVRTFGAAIPPINTEVEQSESDSIILQEYQEFLFPFLKMSHREYGPHRILNLTDGKAPALFPKFDSITFSPNLDYYLVKKEKSSEIKIFSSEYNEKISVLDNSDKSIEQLTFSNNAQWVAGGSGNTIYIWNAKTGHLKHQIEKTKYELLLHLKFDPFDKYLIGIYDPKWIKFFDVESGELYSEKKPTVAEVIAFKARKAKEILEDLKAKINYDSLRKEIFPHRGGVIDRYGSQAGKLIDLVNLTFREYYDIDISPDGRFASAWRDDLASVQFINLESGKKMRKIGDLQSVVVNSVTAELLKSEKESLEKKLLTYYLRERFAFRKFTAISPHWDKMVIATKNKSGENLKTKAKNKIKDIRNERRKKKGKEELEKKEIDLRIRVEYLAQERKEESFRLEESEDYGEGIIFSPDGKMIAASCNTLNKIRIWDANDGSIIKTLDGHSGDIAFTSNSKTLISTGWDRQVKVWDIETEEELYSFIAIKGQNDYITMLPSGYYSTSRKNSRAVAFAFGKEAYPFDQFDIQFNRPDSLLKKFEASIRTSKNKKPNEVLIAAYRRSYEKRLEKNGLTEASFQGRISLPRVTVGEHPLAQKNRHMQIHVTAEDDEYQLSKLYVMVNGAPVLSGGSRDLSGRKSKSYSGSVEFDLSEGANQLQVFVLSKSGITSLKYNSVIKYAGASTTKTLHIVTLGTSNFKDSRFDLHFATTDLIDFRTLYSQRAKDIDQVVEHRLEGQDFTLEKFRALKETLAQTKPDDQVICLFSTHGLLDEKLDYYLATYDVDFDNPDLRGLSYEEIEAFLMTIGARNKLVFLDACHAGEIDDKDIEKAKKACEVAGKVNFVKAVKSTGWEQLPGQQSFDLMKELFVDLRADTGATVIASASAIEFAYEGEKWGNSAFTYCLKRALKEGVADLNNDKQIRVSEIQQYLSYAVSKLTGGNQRPINRVENIFNDFVIW